MISAAPASCSPLSVSPSSSAALAIPTTGTQRQRRHPPGFIAPQQRAPDTIADEGGDKRQVKQRENRQHIDLA